MYVDRLGLHDFRSYCDIDVELGSGVTALIGRNGQGKTNLVEAVEYVARLASHRVSSDTPLVRAGADQAVVRAEVVRADRRALVEVEINPGRSNRARVNRAQLPRPRELLGLVRTVLFAPEDLAIVKGDPGDRRRFLDDLLVQRAPRHAGVRADYDRVLRQRGSLLKSAGPARRRGPGPTSGSGALDTLGVWDSHLARTGAELLATRLAVVHALRPLVESAYQAVAGGAQEDASLAYQASFELPRLDPAAPDRDVLAEALLTEIGRRRDEELERGVCLVGPHRDELVLGVGELPAKGYASHGESWSLALALRLACYDLLRAEGEDPILILDDVFAELDSDRRQRLADLVAGAEQVLVTAAVPDDVPAALKGRLMDVVEGTVGVHVG